MGQATTTTTRSPHHTSTHPMTETVENVGSQHQTFAENCEQNTTGLKL